MASLSSTQRRRLPEQPNIPAFFLPPDIFSSNAYLVAWITQILSGVCTHSLAIGCVCILLKCHVFLQKICEKRWRYLAGSHVKGNGAPERHLAGSHESLKWMSHGKTLWQFTDTIHTHTQYPKKNKKTKTGTLENLTWPKVCGHPHLINGFGYISALAGAKIRHTVSLNKYL